MAEKIKKQVKTGDTGAAKKDSPAKNMKDSDATKHEKGDAKSGASKHPTKEVNEEG